MSARSSAARYARALLDVSITEGDPQQAGNDLSRFAALVEHNADLREALTNPVVPTPSKQRVVQELIARLGIKGPVAKLLVMLAVRDRLALLPDLVDVYRTRLEEHLGVIRAEVTSATELSPEHAQHLQQRLAAATGRRVTMTTRVDPGLIGGVVARIGSTVYDGSVAAQLARMREKLLQEF